MGELLPAEWALGLLLSGRLSAAFGVLEDIGICAGGELGAADDGIST